MTHHPLVFFLTIRTIYRRQREVTTIPEETRRKCGWKTRLNSPTTNVLEHRTRQTTTPDAAIHSGGGGIFLSSFYEDNNNTQFISGWLEKVYE